MVHYNEQAAGVNQRLGVGRGIHQEIMARKMTTIAMVATRKVFPMLDHRSPVVRIRKRLKVSMHEILVQKYGTHFGAEIMEFVQSSRMRRSTRIRAATKSASLRSSCDRPEMS